MEGGRPRPPQGGGGSRGRSPSKDRLSGSGLNPAGAGVNLTTMKSLAALLAILLLNAPAWACAGCRVISKDVEETTVMAGFAFSWGVVAMLAFLFALCSGLGWFVMKTIRSVDARHGSAR